MKGRKYRILVVDDELIIRKLVGDFLRQKGFSVTLAKNGLEAVKLAEKSVFDLFLSDLHMPKMGGDALIKNIKNMPEYKHTPFLFLSGDTNKETWLQNLNSGADDFILKPFDPEVLYLKIRANLKKFDLRKEIINTGKKKIFSGEKGCILFVKTPENSYELNDKNLISKVITVDNEADLLNEINSGKIWLTIIDEEAKWFFEHSNKTKKLFLEQLSAAVLISKDSDSKNLNSYIDAGITNFILKLEERDIVISQINSIIRRENIIKTKYLNALKTAADNSFIRMDYYVDYTMPHFSFSLIHQPFESIPGGDFYEVFTLEDNSKIIVVGDVMGKKWDAWFFVSSYISYIRSLIKLLAHQRFTDIVSHPSKLLENLNKFIYKDAQLSEVFTTLSVIYLNEDDTILRIASAGAQKPLLWDGKEVTTLNIIGTLMGILEEVDYHELELKLQEGQKLLLFTDGYNESTNSATGAMLDNTDVARSFGTMTNRKELSVKDLENHLILYNHIKKFDDDRTMLLINCLG